jgi:predicted metal-dependent hydrolase
MPHLLIDDISVEIVRKPVRQMRLSIRPPQGLLRVTVPMRTTQATIREVVLRKQTWIRKHQAVFQQRTPLPELHYASGETHYYQGQALRLCVQEQPGRARVLLPADAAELHLLVPPGTTPAQRAQVLGRNCRPSYRPSWPSGNPSWEPGPVSGASSR